MDRIRELRAERGLTQVRLAVAADMNPATLNRIEMGKANPNLKTLERLAAALGVPVASLLEDTSPKVEPPLPFSSEPSEAERRLEKVTEVVTEYLMDRAEKHDAEAKDPNSPHFANATAAALWLAGVEDELSTWMDWAERRLHEITPPPANDGLGAALARTVELIFALLGPVMGFDHVTDHARQRIEAMNDAPDELAALRLEKATAAAETSRRRLEDQRKAASG